MDHAKTFQYRTNRVGTNRIAHAIFQTRITKYLGHTLYRTARTGLPRRSLTWVVGEKLCHRSGTLPPPILLTVGCTLAYRTCAQNYTVLPRFFAVYSPFPYPRHPFDPLSRLFENLSYPTTRIPASCIYTHWHKLIYYPRKDSLY